MNCFRETFYKRREELRDIQREINWLQEDLEDLLEKLEDEEEEYKMQLREDKKIPPLAKTETGKPLVDKQLEHKNNERPNHHNETEALIAIVDETGLKESSGNEVDIVDFSKRIAELRKRIEHPTNVCFMPSFFDAEERDQAKPSHLVTKP